ncbi:MAG: hypothetical protein IJ661_10250 [Lachnospiraceae bacterium]|nr:hypothetical protein [Lachnospiraceae bacterium]
MVYSYHKYTSNQKDYCIKNAEVINTKIHTLAGLRGFISCDMRYCTLRYDFNGISYETFTEIFPEYSEGKVIKIAVDYSNPQIINRVEPYSVSDYRWGAQIVVIIFAVLIIKFASALKFVYDTN